MLLNKILELAKEGYSVSIDPAVFEDGLRIVLHTNGSQWYIMKNQIIPYYVLEKLDENGVIDILEEMKVEIERRLKKHD